MVSLGFFSIDFFAVICYNHCSIFGYSENTKTVAVASLSTGMHEFLFCLPDEGR